MIKFSICKTFSICAVAALLTAPTISSANANEVTAVGGVDPIILTPVDPMPAPVLLPTELRDVVYSNTFDNSSSFNDTGLTGTGIVSDTSLHSNQSETFDWGFGDNYLINNDTDNGKTTLTLNNMSDYDYINLDFDVGMVNGWSSGDSLKIDVNGSQVYSMKSSSTNTYSHGSYRIDDYANGEQYFYDGAPTNNDAHKLKAFDLSTDSRLGQIATNGAETVTIEWYATGSNYGQTYAYTGETEAFFIDNVVVTAANEAAVYGAPAPILGGGLGGLIMLLGGVCAAMRKKIAAMPIVQNILSPKLKVAC